ncbi:MAG: DUF4251 domain-containing protein [Prevotella sp.]|nr:DUF4251 domain-containing protein [Prevotella sp.]
MKKLLGLLTMVLGLTACTTSKTAEQKNAQYLQQMSQLADSLRNRTYTISFDYVMPRRSGGHFLTSDYSVTVKGDSITSFLPYFGVAYRADWNNQYHSPLDFKGLIMAYDYAQRKKDSYRVMLKTKNGMDQMVYQLQVFANGKATLDVLPTDREPISFTGNLKWEEQR